MSIMLAAFAVSTIATLAGSLLSASGQIQQGEAANQAAQYRSAVLRNNRIIAQRAAATKSANTAIAVAKAAIVAKQLKGFQRVTFAAHGVDLGSGSVSQILADTAALARQNTLTIEDTGNRQAAALLHQGENFGFEANLLEAQGESAITAGRIGAGTALLSGVGSVAQKWYGYKKAGG